jgi:hypothetical protein
MPIYFICTYNFQPYVVTKANLCSIAAQDASKMGTGRDDDRALIFPGAHLII